jgi:phospholipase C
LASIENIVVLMLENRSFDHMLGYLYADTGNVSPLGQSFDGLSGTESNPDSNGASVQVFQLDAATTGAYFSPGADPGEGYVATNAQLFGANTAPVPPVATNSGFVTNFASTLSWEQTAGRSIRPGTVATDIMGMFTPEMLPVLSGLARGYAVCDQWFASAPTETLPNRAFACAATSQGHMDDGTHSYTCQSIFGALSAHGVSWAIYGYDAQPLTRLNFSDTTKAPDANFGEFAEFTSAAADGSLPAYTFLEPSWGSTGNSQHPNYDVSLGEQLIHDVYYALRSGPGWPGTLFVITYDEHGGCFDHVAPPAGAIPPDANVGEFGFDFTRFGVRVPAVLVSPLIEAGTVFRVPAGTMPIDHTTILHTVEERFGVPALTARDAAAPGLGGVLSLASPRTDDPLAGVVVPTSTGVNAAAQEPSHLQQVYADLASRLPVPDSSGAVIHALPPLHTTQDYTRYITDRTAAWKASRRPGSAPAAPS